MTEITTPGWGVPGTAGFIALALFFGARMLTGLAGLEVVLLFVLGVGLLLLEILVIPGFGIAGVLGIVAVLASLFLSFPDIWSALAAVGLRRGADVCRAPSSSCGGCRGRVFGANFPLRPAWSIRVSSKTTPMTRSSRWAPGSGAVAAAPGGHDAGGWVPDRRRVRRRVSFHRGRWWGRARSRRAIGVTVKGVPRTDANAETGHGSRERTRGSGRNVRSARRETDDGSREDLPVLIILVLVIMFVIVFFNFIPVGLWISAWAAGVRVPILTLVGMRLRRVPPHRIVMPLIKAMKAGIGRRHRQTGSPLLGRRQRGSGRGRTHRRPPGPDRL